jgi:hypothetical protein
VIHGRLADGRVDVTALQAWPSPPAVRPLKAEEVARACALLAACASDLLASWGPDDTDDDPALVAALCPRLTSWFEERAIPLGPSNERWAWLAELILQTGADCGKIRAAITHRPEAIECEETGCRWDDGVATRVGVTCQGELALIATETGAVQRDCSRSLLRCEPLSPTGCSDRPSVGCIPFSLDRCDGAVKLGCDRYGRVSWHDCSHRPFGRCEEDARGAACKGRGEACRADQATCKGGKLRLCVDGAWTDVGCRELGLGACKKGERGAWCGVVEARAR